MRRYLQSVLCTVALWAIASSTIAQQTVEFPLSAGNGGALELSMSVDGEFATFLLDTGAAMATINSALFNRISDHGTVHKTREVAARMADGRTRRLAVYEVNGLTLGEGCDLGPTEVIVVPGSGRNLLGLNVLQKFAPLTLSLSPPALALSNCTAMTVAASSTIDIAAAIAP